MNNPKVSIIIPVHNEEKTIANCIESVLNQNYKDYELIIVDNNSVDNTRKIINFFEKKSKKIRYFFEEEIGRGPARNAGERKSKGEIILMTDSDCIVPVDWIEKAIQPIINNEADAVQGFEKSSENGFWSKQYQIRAEKKFKGIILQGKQILGNIDTKNFAIKKSLLKLIGFSSEDYISGNDTDISIKLSKTDAKIKFLNNEKVAHLHKNSFKKIFRQYFYRGFWTAKITDDNADYLRNTGFIEKTQQTLFYFFKFFPGLIITLFLKGPAYMYFDLVTGIAWRAGIVKYKINLLFFSIKP